MESGGQEGTTSTSACGSPATEFGYSASFVSSALMFILTGFLTVSKWAQEHYSPALRWEISLTAAINTFYFYYWIAYSEYCPKAVHHLRDIRTNGTWYNRMEWHLRWFNQLLLFATWYWLSQGYVQYFGYSYVAMYGLYLLWDFVTGTGTGNWNKTLIYLDFFGLFVSLGIAITSQSLQINPSGLVDQATVDRSNIFGLFFAAFLGMSLGGIFEGHKTFPEFFSRKLWRAIACR